MLILTSEHIPGKSYEVIAMVRGLTVYSKNIGKDIMSIFKGAVGGEMKAYTEMSTECLSVATDRMVAEAKLLHADAILCARYDSCVLLDGVIQFVAYGTAVKFLN
ncbi:MAG: PlcB, ldh protein [Herbinix sp.]|nr:PlcB, ldh protein [Herbinix sp.]